MSHARHYCRMQTTLLVILLATTAAHAGDWDIVPRLTVAEDFSDNVKLDEANKESEFITEINPGISLHGRGGRVTANLDYNMQNVFYLSDSDANEIFHQLSANATAEMSKNFFFVDATSTISQAIIDAGSTVSTSNLNILDNRTNVYTYSISPYITPHFGAYADGVFRYDYGLVKYGSGASDGENNAFRCQPGQRA